MTEKTLVEAQEKVYQMLLNYFKQNQIPPILQKIIMEGIYSRFQTNAFCQFSFISDDTNTKEEKE